MADKNFKVKNNIVVNDVEIDPSSPTAEQILRYNGTKFLAANSGIPTGGLEGQILSKITDTSYDTQWIDNFADQLRVIAKNNTASTINKGVAVMSTGSAGDRITIAPANADGSIEVKYMLGVTTENIAVDAEGYVTLVGPVTGLNTNAYTVGDILYIDPNTPGAFTTTQPTAPDVDLPLAIVLKKNASAGIIFVRMWSQGAKLGELQDVNVAGVTDGQVLTYDSATSTWIAETAPGGGGGDTTSTYVTLTTSSTLSNERVLTAGTGINITDGGAGGNVTIDTTAILLTIVDNKGDLIVGSGADTVVRLANATANNQVLVSNSATASGLEWDDPYTIPQTIDTAKTGAYTIQAADAGKFLRMNATADFTVANTTGFSSGQRVDIIRLGAGACGVVAGSGVTINSAIGLELRAQYSAASIVCIAANSYYVIGDLSV